MQGRRQDIARLQSDFFRDKYHATLRWLLCAVFVIYLLLAATLFIIFFQPTQHYYANTINGIIFSMPTPRHN